MPKRITLSLCMIVKNEAQFLPDCLASMKDVVDEIVIVDTGSLNQHVERPDDTSGTRILPKPSVQCAAA